MWWFISSRSFATSATTDAATSDIFIGSYFDIDVDIKNEYHHLNNIRNDTVTTNNNDYITELINQGNKMIHDNANLPSTNKSDSDTYTMQKFGILLSIFTIILIINKYI